jgi:CubicO group peptidase (beta-lactamase class C family)
MAHKNCRALITLAFLCSLIGCNNDNPVATYSYTTPPNVNDGWETASLSSVGISEELVSFLIDNINYGTYPGVHSVLIVKDNKLVLEKYWAGHDFRYSDPDFHGAYVQFDRNTRHNTHSATKSITSALVGIAIDGGLIGSVDDKIFRYLPNYQ